MKNLNAIEDFQNFKINMNIQKIILSSANFKESKISKIIRKIILLLLVGSSIVNIIRISNSNFNNFYFITMILSFILIYVYNIFYKRSIYNCIKRLIPSFEQNLVKLTFFKIDYDNLFIKEFWLDKVYNKYETYSDLNINYLIEYFKNELMLIQKSKLLFDNDFINKLIQIVVPVSSLFYFLLEGNIESIKFLKFYLKLLLLIIITTSPIIIVLIQVCTDENDKKNDDIRMMQEYQYCLTQILNRRKRNLKGGFRSYMSKILYDIL